MTVKTREEIIAILRDGGIVILPTDTAFALSCRIDNTKSVERLFTIKQRSQTQPTPILVANEDMVRKYVIDIPKKAEELMQSYWPGALTIVLKANTKTVPPLVRGHADTVGVRQPNSIQTLDCISEVGVPLIGTSANFHGKQTPYSMDAIDPALADMVDGVLAGVCPVGNVSTIVDVTKDTMQILRLGAVHI